MLEMFSRGGSLKALSADITCVVVADISGFSENVEHPLLISELEQLEHQPMQ